MKPAFILIFLAGLAPTMLRAAESSVPSAPPAASAAPAPSAPAPTPAPAPEGGSLKIDIGQAKLNLLLQTWAVSDDTPTSAKTNFRARRAEMKLSGNINPESRWVIMIDPAKGLKTGAIDAKNDNKVLQDLGLVYTPWSAWEFSIGQFKIPTIAEGLDSSADLPLPERSLLARTFGDKRQLGAQGIYKEAKWKITAMVSNGGNTNTDDTTTAKDLNVRGDFNPFSGFSFGGFVGATDARFGENGKWGLNVRWKGENEFARYEMAKSDETVAGTKTKSDGYAAEVGYSVLPALQPVLRFERFFPNSLSEDSSKATTLGLNYFLHKNNQKFQAAYSWLTLMKGGNGSYASDTGIGPGRLFVLSFQMAI